MKFQKKHLLLCTIPLAGGVLYLAAGGNIGTLATFGLIAACPLMHLFMPHGDHKHDMMEKKGGEHQHEA